MLVPKTILSLGKRGQVRPEEVRRALDALHCEPQVTVKGRTIQIRKAAAGYSAKLRAPQPSRFRLTSNARALMKRPGSTAKAAKDGAGRPA
jgi:hypothetical protein